jgi:hypothetical protein
MKDEKLEQAKKTVFPRWLVIILIMATAGITASALSAPAAEPAALSGAPVIVWGTPIGHGDRGACTNCHNVVFPQGTPLPTITALSAMPHEFRGVCNNCHRIKVSRFLGLLDRLLE